MENVDEIMAVIAKMEGLANKRDVDGLMALHHTDETAFLFGDKVNYKGNHQHCANGYAAIHGEFLYKFNPIHIDASPEMAVVVGEERIKGETDSGQIRSVINATYYFKKIDGSWLIIHQHLSTQNQAQERG
jgi:ketosteroid isomerase-like protein